MLKWDFFLNHTPTKVAKLYLESFCSGKISSVFNLNREIQSHPCLIITFKLGTISWLFNHCATAACWILWLTYNCKYVCKIDHNGEGMNSCRHRTLTIDSYAKVIVEQHVLDTYAGKQLLFLSHHRCLIKTGIEKMENI